MEILKFGKFQKISEKFFEIGQILPNLAKFDHFKE